MFSLCKAACHDKFLALAPWPRWLDMGRIMEGDGMDMEGYRLMVDMKLGKPWLTQQIHTNTHMTSQISPGIFVV